MVLRRVGSILAWIAWMLVTLAAQAQADDGDAQAEEARHLYNEAREAFKQDRYSEAALGFEAASKMRPHAVALYTAAQAWELAGEPARAADAYVLALSTPKLEDDQAKRARERLAALEPELGTVVVLGAEQTHARLDDHMEVSLPARLHASPGAHVLYLVRPGGAAEQRELDVKKGETVEVDADSPQTPPAVTEAKPRTVPLAEPKQNPVSPERDSKRSPLLLTAGFVTAGAGVAALGGALLLGLGANDAESTYRAAPSRETLDHARSLETKTNFMLAVGSVLTLAGAGLIVWQSVEARDRVEPAARRPPHVVRVRAAPGAAFIEGFF